MISGSSSARRSHSHDKRSVAEPVSQLGVGRLRRGAMLTASAIRGSASVEPILERASITFVEATSQRWEG